MITETQQEELKKVLKRNWADDVLRVLKRRRIKNKHGKWHTKGLLRQVLYGNVENEDVEKAILDVYEKTLTETKAIEARKAKLLSA